MWDFVGIFWPGGQSWQASPPWDHDTAGRGRGPPRGGVKPFLPNQNISSRVNRHKFLSLGSVTVPFVNRFPLARAFPHCTTSPLSTFPRRSFAIIEFFKTVSRLPPPAAAAGVSNVNRLDVRPCLWAKFLPLGKNLAFGQHCQPTNLQLIALKFKRLLDFNATNGSNTAQRL